MNREVFFLESESEGALGEVLFTRVFGKITWRFPLCFTKAEEFIGVLPQPRSQRVRNSDIERM